MDGQGTKDATASAERVESRDPDLISSPTDTMFPTLPTWTRSAGIPFKRASQGLFEGLTKQYGNNVPHSMKKTRRTWTPNVQTKRLFSETLGHHVTLQVTTRALRTIDKHGGLDGYLLGVNCLRLGQEGMRLRMLVKEKKGIVPVVGVE